MKIVKKYDIALSELEARALMQLAGNITHTQMKEICNLNDDQISALNDIYIIFLKNIFNPYKQTR